MGDCGRSDGRLRAREEVFLLSVAYKKINQMADWGAYTIRTNPSVATMSGATPVFSRAMAAMMRPLFFGWLCSRMTTMPPANRTG